MSKHACKGLWHIGKLQLLLPYHFEEKKIVFERFKGKFLFFFREGNQAKIRQMSQR